MSSSILNTYYSFISFFLKSLSGLALPFVVSNVLGTDYFSDFSFYLIVGSLFLVLCEYGSIFWMPNSAQVSICDFKTQLSSRAFCEALNVRVFFVVAATLILSVVVIFEILSFTNFMLILALIMYSFFSLFYYAFRSIGLFKREFRLSMVLEITVFIIPTVCLLLFRSYEIFVLTFFGSRLVLVLFLFRFFNLVPRISFSTIVKTISLRFPYFFQVAISFIVLYVDTFFVKLLYPSELYLHQGFLRLSLLFCLFVPVLNSIFLYYMRSNFLVSVERYLKFFKRLTLAIFTVSLAFSVGSFIAFPVFVDFILGDQYLDLHRYSLEFSILICLKYLSTIFGLHLTVIGLQVLRAKLLFWVFLVGSLGLYFLLRELGFHYIFYLMVLFNLLIFLGYFTSYLKFKISHPVLSDV